jgi:N-ethylmaleimide reductase
MTKLFDPVRVGPYALSHRVVLAPMTRLRAEQPGDRPGELMAEFYGQRATQDGLLIAESTPVARNGIAYAGGPGAYLDSQIEGWRKVTDAVHAKGGRIFLQLSHSGRMSHPDIIEGEVPAGPSVVRAEGGGLTEQGYVDFAVPRALDVAEIPGILAQYRSAADRALQAGFDGVELHAANGYLPDQFLQDGTNLRTDEYGGPVERRARFLLESFGVMASVWGSNRVGVRLSPSGQFAGMGDSDPEATFGYVAHRLGALGAAYLHVIEPRIKGPDDLVEGVAAPAVAAATLRKYFQGPIIAAGGFNPESARTIVSKGFADMVAFGRPFVANPDLPERIRSDIPLAAHDRATLYGGDHRGYTDYPKASASMAA